jgi:hypothetical protein
MSFAVGPGEQENNGILGGSTVPQNKILSLLLLLFVVINIANIITFNINPQRNA